MANVVLNIKKKSISYIGRIYYEYFLRYITLGFFLYKKLNKKKFDIRTKQGPREQTEETFSHFMAAFFFWKNNQRSKRHEIPQKGNIRLQFKSPSQDSKMIAKITLNCFIRDFYCRQNY